MRPWTEAVAATMKDGGELQWGHGLAAVDGDESGRVWVADSVLQWGHGLAAVDGRSTSLPVNSS